MSVFLLPSDIIQLKKQALDMNLSVSKMIHNYIQQYGAAKEAVQQLPPVTGKTILPPVADKHTPDSEVFVTTQPEKHVAALRKHKDSILFD